MTRASNNEAKLDILDSIAMTLPSDEEINRQLREAGVITAERWQTFGHRRRMVAFIRGYIETGTVTGAFRRCHVPIRTHLRWLTGCDAYRRAFEGLRFHVGQMLEDAAVDLAINGDPLDEDGNPTHKRYPALLLRLLESFRPEYYKPSKAVKIRANFQQNNIGGTSITIPQGELSEARVARIEALREMVAGLDKPDQLLPHDAGDSTGQPA